MTTSSTQPLFWVLLPAGLMLCGCTPTPRPLHLGTDVCAHCRMTISDARFAAELVTPTGKVYPFDAVECLAAFVRASDRAAIHSLWVTDFQNPDVLLRAEDALFLRSNALHSPMGGGLAAFAADAPNGLPATGFEGDVLDWPAVLARAGQHPDHAAPVVH